MKKHLLRKIFIAIGIVALVSTGVINKSYTVFAEHDSTEDSYFKLVSDDVNVLWIGDDVTSSEGIGNKQVYTVIEGDSVEIKESQWGTQSIKAIKEGYSKVQIDYYNIGYEVNELLESKTYEIKVIKREKEIEFTEIPKSLKIGEKIKYNIFNGNYGSIPGIYISEANNSFRMPGYGGPADTRNWPGYIFTAVKYDKDGNEYTKDIHNLALEAFYPGTYSYGMYEDLDYDAIKAGTLKPIGTGEIIVEEPVIKTNMPEIVKPGESLDFKTELSNLCLEDEKTTGLLKAIYHPEITVIDGEDCIKCSDEKNEQLCSSEKIEFVKEGTVTLNIKYVATTPEKDSTSNLDFDWGNEVPKLYTAEKTISVKITNESNIKDDDSDNKKTDSKNNSLNDNKTDDKSDSKLNSKSDSKLNSKTDSKLNSKSDSKTEKKSLSNDNKNENPKTGDTNTYVNYIIVLISVGIFSVAAFGKKYLTIK